MKSAANLASVINYHNPVAFRDGKCLDSSLCWIYPANSLLLLSSETSEEFGFCHLCSKVFLIMGVKDGVDWISV